MSSQLSARELLELGDEGRTKTVLSKYWPQILGTFFGIGSASFINFQTRRPIFSGIQKHILLTAGLMTAFIYMQKHRDNYFAEKDAVLRHYLELHPDEFEEPPRKKIADIFEPWVPVR
ncbi:NADH dehydrogenase [ubiquinone] 1 subunit C2 [Spodoptera litura]|uniref:NADH dehydrogenase [ubiquinone] 1 subunit C2 n=1 Tax=Spodoptera litura TaxID=69820 RepID=A0A9J7DRE3_SPOLT|nr:NADH dehydrogenase [ubiquinone] 1 subunit C2 [Spodoptera litura]